MDPRFSRAYGALAGLALGDALGMPTQAMSPEQIRAVYGRITGLADGDASQPYAPGMPAGSVTDDTEQALLVASLLVRGRGSSCARPPREAGHPSAHHPTAQRILPTRRNKNPTMWSTSRLSPTLIAHVKAYLPVFQKNLPFPD